MTITSEFPGWSFAPEVQALLDEGRAEDSSWHNDCYPTVSWSDANGNTRVMLSDAGADPAARNDDAEFRFSIWTLDPDGFTNSDEDDLCTNDPVMAVAGFRMRVEQVKLNGKRRRESR